MRNLNTLLDCLTKLGSARERAIEALEPSERQSLALLLGLSLSQNNSEALSPTYNKALQELENPIRTILIKRLTTEKNSKPLRPASQKALQNALQPCNIHGTRQE